MVCLSPIPPRRYAGVADAFAKANREALHWIFKIRTSGWEA